MVINILQARSIRLGIVTSNLVNVFNTRNSDEYITLSCDSGQVWTGG